MNYIKTHEYIGLIKKHEILIILEWIDKTLDRVKIKIEGLELKNKADEHFKKGIELIKGGQSGNTVFKECIPLYEEAIAVDVTNECAYSNLINVYGKLGDTEKVKETIFLLFEVYENNIFLWDMRDDLYEL